MISCFVSLMNQNWQNVLNIMFFFSFRFCIKMHQNIFSLNLFNTQYSSYRNTTTATATATTTTTEMETETYFCTFFKTEVVCLNLALNTYSKDTWEKTKLRERRVKKEVEVNESKRECFSTGGTGLREPKF